MEGVKCVSWRIIRRHVEVERNAGEGWGSSQYVSLYNKRWQYPVEFNGRYTRTYLKRGFYVQSLHSSHANKMCVKSSNLLGFDAVLSDTSLHTFGAIYCLHLHDHALLAAGLTFRSWRRQFRPPKYRWTSTGVHGVFFLATAVRTSNPNIICVLSTSGLSKIFSKETGVMRSPWRLYVLILTCKPGQ